MRTALGQNSYVSVGLVTALVMAALFYGRQLEKIEKIDAIEAQLRDLSREVGEIRSLVVRAQATGR